MKDDGNKGDQMKIQISEVWNAEGKSEKLAIIDGGRNPAQAVRDWIAANRPDLDLANTLYAHGYHAIAI